MAWTLARGGFRTFAWVWLGQAVSLVGTQLTTFAVGVWLYQTTGSVSLYTLLYFLAALSAVSISPLAGALVDRWDRRWAMVWSDTGAALTTVTLLALLLADALELWQLFVLAAANAAFGSLQFPAFSAATTLLVPRRHLGRASGMVQVGEAGARILGPLLGGVLLVRIHLEGVIAVDIATFLVAVTLLFLVRFPAPVAAVGAESGGQRSLFREAIFGWDYLRQRPELLRLLRYFALINLLLPIGLILATPLVLSFASPEELGAVLGFGAAGALVGSLVMSTWGGPRRRIHGILGFTPLAAFGYVLAGLAPSVTLVAAGLFLSFFVMPIVNGCSQAIWQSKVRPELQGRVFAMRRMVAQFTAPLAYLVAGPLAELFEPLLESDGLLAGSVGRLLGTGEGRGLALLLIVVGVGLLLNALWGFAQPRLRRLEETLPDAVGEEPTPGG
jgi:MFS family permease